MGTMIEQSPRFTWSDLPTDITTSLPFLVKLLVTDANGESNGAGEAKKVDGSAAGEATSVLPAWRSSSRPRSPSARR